MSVRFRGERAGREAGCGVVRGGRARCRRMSLSPMRTWTPPSSRGIHRRFELDLGRRSSARGGCAGRPAPGRRARPRWSRSPRRFRRARLYSRRNSRAMRGSSSARRRRRSRREHVPHLAAACRRRAIDCRASWRCSNGMCGSSRRRTTVRSDDGLRERRPAAPSHCSTVPSRSASSNAASA